MIRDLITEWREGFAALSPARFPYRRFGLALAIGLCGALVFNHYQLPLAWMLGAMLFCMLATLLRIPVTAPSTIRPPVIAIVGVLLGSGFSPQILAGIGSWIPTLLGLFAFMLVSGVVCVTYLCKVGGFDLKTAYFAGMPGGLAEMIVLGDDKGADTRLIAMVHSARVFTIVMTLPFVVQWLSGVDLGSRGRSAGLSLFEVHWSTPAWLFGVAVAGAILGHLLRLPSKYLMGPMLLSLIVHVSGISDFHLPREIVSGAQLVLGTVVGCRFAGTTPGQILKVLRLALGATVMLLLITLGFAEIVSFLSSYEQVPLMLAYSPGGLAEMSLIAVAMQIEVAFVATHHIVRILAVMIFARVFFPWIDRQTSA
ncbi:monooxygenase [Agaricicola taiwanensis]|uniref:Monooxygenase n=1 Tax=Agaricicola taiwanensis TaxID=591372 RepID=A0A8J2VL90_9RHOB|nr:AbrB family transcriptional regulator [Agaricicola taiwanensis]GGE29572.1 monooxygenase [Agaricicola taiwanensis]